jgi:DNA-binding NarL/FixJ family response regulator
MSVRIIVAEDHPLLRHGLRTLVEAISGHTVVDDATCGREAIQKTLLLLPDLLLLDLSLPDISGADIVHQIRRKLPQQKIIALSDSRGDIHASEALRAGCQGYMLKDTSFEEISLAIKTVMLGRRFISQNVTDQLVGDLLDIPNQRAGRATWALLTSRERSVFKLIAQGKTNRATAEYLALSPKTVEKHRASLMRKLELHSAVELALLAVDLGIVERPDVSQTIRLRAGHDAVAGLPPQEDAVQSA